MLTLKEVLEAPIFYHVTLRNKDRTALRYFPDRTSPVCPFRGNTGEFCGSIDEYIIIGRPGKGKHFLIATPYYSKGFFPGHPGDPVFWLGYDPVMRRRKLGLADDTPDYIVNDKMIEEGLIDG